MFLVMDAPVNTKTALLQALIRGEGYGLELIDRVRQRTKGAVKLHMGNTYPALRELEAEGLVKSWEADPTPERGGRPRRYYKLTATGQRAATEQKQAIAGLFGLAPEIAR
jgi:PadR family transcriptional regulator, regulatory protein PadR